jgi:hypothetical protein
MVAKITVPNSIKRALNYNEQKMKEGVAECIYAHNFLKEAERLNFYEKLSRFENLISRNKRASTNTVHISLNFGLNEKIEKEKLAEIASVYMKKSGLQISHTWFTNTLMPDIRTYTLLLRIFKRMVKEFPCIILEEMNQLKQEKKLRSLTSWLKQKIKKNNNRMK